MYQTWATTSENGKTRQMDFCGKCYKLFLDKQNQHNFLAYKETVEEVTGKTEDKTWLKKYLGFWR
jgi:hypothetical protein